MKDIIKKSVYLGLGLATTTKEKVESLVDSMIEKGEVKKEEKAKAIKEILANFEADEKEFREKTKQVVHETLSNIGFATKREITEMQKEISELREKIIRQ